MILAHLTLSFGPAEGPSQNGFHLIKGIGSGAALAPPAIASFIPTRRSGGVPGIDTPESEHGEVVNAAR
ncbi:hypothetical protein [Actinophytocola sp.]|uniref:hypothetical protein n=1 Tax=Actinophytocola sp. TaxID=1872138 RepID=UPI00389A3679